MISFSSVKVVTHQPGFKTFISNLLEVKVLNVR